MTSAPQVVLSAFADEAANRKTALEQLSALAAVGLKQYSPRFIDVNSTGEVKHVVTLNKAEYQTLAKLHVEYGVRVTSIGSRIGKVKLQDKEDGSHNKFVPFKDYLKTEVASTINAAHALDTKLIRGFSFYPPRGEDPQKFFQQAVDQIGQIADICGKEGLVYGLEIEPNLMGDSGAMMAKLARAVKRKNMLLIFDGGNVACQNKNAIQCYQEYLEMRDYLGWMHIKDYKIESNLTWTGAVDEERLKNFVPCDRGDGGHDLVLKDLREHLPKLEKRIKSLGATGFYLEVEPHLKGGGQFGGFSGPDGLGVAVRSLCRLLDYVQIGYQLRSFDDIRTLRGF